VRGDFRNEESLLADESHCGGLNAEGSATSLLDGRRGGQQGTSFVVAP